MISSDLSVHAAINQRQSTSGVIWYLLKMHLPSKEKNRSTLFRQVKDRAYKLDVITKLLILIHPSIFVCKCIHRGVYSKRSQIDENTLVVS